MSPATSPAWAVVATNRPTRPVRCGLCRRQARWPVTYKLWRPGLDPTGSRRGPGLWACGDCCAALNLDHREVQLWSAT
jgi:hypothetical protein